jgi:hypothetical protein
MEPLKSGRYTSAEFVFYLDMCFRLQNKQPLKYDFKEIGKFIEFHGDLRYLEYEIQASNAAELSFAAKYLLDTACGPNGIVLLAAVIKNDVHAHVEIGENLRHFYRHQDILEAVRAEGVELMDKNHGMQADEVKRMLVRSHFSAARRSILANADVPN